MTPLRRRMTEDMQLRNLSPHTQRAYLRYIALFAQRFQKSPELLGPTEIRAYRRWCRNRIVDVGWSPCALSGDAPRHRHAEPGHAVQRRAADPGLGLLSGQRPGAKATADEGLVPGHGRFAQRPPAVTGRFLPSHAPLVPDQLDVAVPLAGRGAGIHARRRRRAWRTDHVHRWVGLALGHGPVDGLAVIRPVRDDRPEGAGDLFEQGGDLGGV